MVDLSSKSESFHEEERRKRETEQYRGTDHCLEKAK